MDSVGENNSPGYSLETEEMRPARPDLALRFDTLWEVLSPAWQGFVEACWRQPGRSENGVLAMHLAPAAKAGRHHGFVGGLLEHTLEVAEIALQLAQLPDNRGRARQEIIVAGALVHDLGKSWTYSWDEAGGGCRRSALGRQVSHIATGQELVQLAVETLVQKQQVLGIEGDDLAHIIHIIKTHHGVPNPPKTLEGLMVQLADSASAGLAMMREGEGQAAVSAVGSGLSLSAWWGRLLRHGRTHT